MYQSQLSCSSKRLYESQLCMKHWCVAKMKKSGKNMAVLKLTHNLTTTLAQFNNNNEYVFVSLILPGFESPFQCFWRLLEAYSKCIVQLPKPLILSAAQWRGTMFPMLNRFQGLLTTTSKWLVSFMTKNCYLKNCAPQYFWPVFDTLEARGGLEGP